MNLKSMGASAACAGWVFMIFACGLPLFSYVSTDLGAFGMGIWGRGTWAKGIACDALELVDQSCYGYSSYDDDFKSDWMKTAEAMSIMSLFSGAVVVFLGKSGSTLLASLLALITMVLAVCPFALWEENVCGTDFGDVRDGNIDGGVEFGDCKRSWSFAFQVIAFLLFGFAAVALCFGGGGAAKMKKEVVKKKAKKKKKKCTIM